MDKSDGISLTFDCEEVALSALGLTKWNSPSAVEREEVLASAAIIAGHRQPHLPPLETFPEPMRKRLTGPLRGGIEANEVAAFMIAMPIGEIRKMEMFSKVINGDFGNLIGVTFGDSLFAGMEGEKTPPDVGLAADTVCSHADWETLLEAGRRYIELRAGGESPSGVS